MDGSRYAFDRHPTETPDKKRLARRLIASGLTLSIYPVIALLIPGLKEWSNSTYYYLLYAPIAMYVSIAPLFFVAEYRPKSIYWARRTLPGNFAFISGVVLLVMAIQGMKLWDLSLGYLAIPIGFIVLAVASYLPWNRIGARFNLSRQKSALEIKAIDVYNNPDNYSDEEKFEAFEGFLTELVNKGWDRNSYFITYNSYTNVMFYHVMANFSEEHSGRFFCQEAKERKPIGWFRDAFTIPELRGNVFSSDGFYIRRKQLPMVVDPPGAAIA